MLIAQYRCVYCGAPSFRHPSDQEPPPDYCHPEDHAELYEDEYEDYQGD